MKSTDVCGSALLWALSITLTLARSCLGVSQTDVFAVAAPERHRQGSHSVAMCNGPQKSKKYKKEKNHFLMSCR